MEEVQGTFGKGVSRGRVHIWCEYWSSLAMQWPCLVLLAITILLKMTQRSQSSNCLELFETLFGTLWNLFISLGNDYPTLLRVTASKTALWMFHMMQTTFWSKNNRLLSTTLHTAPQWKFREFPERFLGQWTRLKTPREWRSHRNTHVSMPCISLSSR